MQKHYSGTAPPATPTPIKTRTSAAFVLRKTSETNNHITQANHTHPANIS